METQKLEVQLRMWRVFFSSSSSSSSLASFSNVWLLTRPLALSKSYPGIRLFDRSIINAVFIFIPSAFLCLFTPMCPHLPGFLFSLSGVDVTRKEEIE